MDKEEIMGLIDKEVLELREAIKEDTENSSFDSGFNIASVLNIKFLFELKKKINENNRECRI